jgi:hypothetical protein
LAAEGGHDDAVKLLLARGAHPMDSSPDGRSAVWLAADGGHHGVVRALSAAIESYGGHPGVTHALTAGKAIGRVRKGRRASC